MDTIDELMRRNHEFVAARDERKMRSARPTLSVTILTCMDARIDPVRVLGLVEGEAHVLRNAGAAVSEDVIRSLVVSQFALGTEDIMLIRHADCGLRTPKKGELFSQVAAASGAEPPFRMGTFVDPEEALRADLRVLRESPFLICTDKIRGFIYAEDTGKLQEVV